MKFIYLVRARYQSDNRNNEFDLLEGVVVCATNPKAARKIAFEEASEDYEDRDVWLDTKKTKTKMIGIARLATKSGVCLRAYRMG